jgi:hypothetical protein
MSFLDSLENNLKSLESRDESAQQSKDDIQKREAERARAQAAAPYAEQLKSSPFTAELLNQVTRLGHSQRIKVHIAWLGTTLRLEARERKLELRPSADGVVAVSMEKNTVLRSEKVDLSGDPAALAEAWLNTPA